MPRVARLVSFGDRLLVLVTLGSLAPLTACANLGALPASAVAAAADPARIETAAIEGQEICVGSAVASAGTLGDTLYYRATTLPDGRLVVGYFAFFSQERPWGNNWLTWAVLPALVVDTVYSHAFLAAPGLQRAISGKGDVEGFRIVYRLADDGVLHVERAVADDGSHAPVYLAAAEVLARDPHRPTLYSDVWSHQLGGRGRSVGAPLVYQRCFGRGRIQTLPETIAQEFDLGRRARPAHVETLGGRLLDAPVQHASNSTRPRR